MRSEADVSTCVKWVPSDGGQQCTVVYSDFPVLGSSDEVTGFVSAVAVLFVAVFLWRIFRRV